MTNMEKHSGAGSWQRWQLLNTCPNTRLSTRTCLGKCLNPRLRTRLTTCLNTCPNICTCLKACLLGCPLSTHMPTHMHCLNLCLLTCVLHTHMPGYMRAAQAHASLYARRLPMLHTHYTTATMANHLVLSTHVRQGNCCAALSDSGSRDTAYAAGKCRYWFPALGFDEVLKLGHGNPVSPTAGGIPPVGPIQDEKGEPACWSVADVNSTVKRGCSQPCAPPFWDDFGNNISVFFSCGLRG